MKEGEPFVFEIPQQEFLSKNLKYYKYFEHLYSGMTPSEIQQKYKLTQDGTDKCLKKLVELKLVQVDSNTKVTFFQKGKTHTTWSGHEPIGIVYNDQLLESLVKRAKASGTSHPDVNSSLFGLSLTDKEAHQFEEEYAKLLAKYQSKNQKKSATIKTKFYSDVFMIGEDKSDFFPEVDNAI